MRKFKKVAVGGTFDELHRGHRVLLQRAFEIGDRVLIGLCSDEFVKKLGKPHVTAPYQERLKELEAFLENLNHSGRADIVTLNDPYGPTVADKCIQALVVSEETNQVAERINGYRIEKRLKPLRIIVVKMVPSEDCAPISTTKIRRGEIDREGRLTKRSKN